MTCPHAFPSLAIPLIGTRARAGAGAHDPDADPAATDATFDTAIAESAVADDALLATATAAAATDTAELITIATTWPAPSRTSARPRRGGMRH